jgi:D-alanyl-D-alanine carboxypeptidase
MLSLVLLAPVSASAAEKDAALVIDAQTGKVLYARNADAPRIPASLTKMMTLYLLFEQVDKGKIKLTDYMRVSAFAASQEPSRLGLRKGEAIRVKDAIAALVIRSANDVAVVVAEAIGGSEAKFARMMTQKARSLRMANTNFYNASGLPHPYQRTTARDLALLGQSLMKNYPALLRLFQNALVHV